MFRKISIVFTLLAICGTFFGSQLKSQADTSYVNGHVFTKPGDGNLDYYWIRALIDPVWGINGFMYISAGDNFYYVVPTDVEFVTNTDVIVSAPVLLVDNVTPGYLQAEFWSSGGVNYAGYVVTSLFDPTVILDYSPSVQTTGSGYLRLRAPK